MNANYKTAAFGGRLTFQVQGETAKDIFRQLSQVQEVFDAEISCGCCGKVNVRLLARQVDEYDFYELACLDCHARFAFGQSKKGGALFPKRKDEDGNYLPNRGWAKYEPKGKDEKAGSAGTKTEKRDGVPVYADWQAAEAGPHWGADWLDVGGKLYKISDSGAYREVARAAAPKK